MQDCMAHAFAASMDMQRWRETTYSSVLEHGDGRIDLCMAQHPIAGLGLQVWRGAKMLCIYLELRGQHGCGPFVYDGCRVLELGSGPGLAGIFMAHLGAHVTLTDLEIVIPMTRHNVELNAIRPTGRGSLGVQELQWGVDIRDKYSRRGDFDLIIGTELIYRDELHALLLITLLQLMTQDTEVLFAHARRSESQFARWKKRFERCLDVQEVVTEEETQDYVDCGFVSAAPEPVSIWRLRLIGPPVSDEDLTMLFANLCSKDSCEWLSLLALTESDLDTIEVGNIDEVGDIDEGVEA